MSERDRRALSQIGGPVRAHGEDALAGLLTRAWERAEREDQDVLTHGFHSWPARMHWALARTILEGTGARTVLDPFCGGGTVLVEARVAGARSTGVDLNPLAIRLCEVKCDARPPEARRRFLANAEQVAAASEARVRGRVPIRVDLPPQEIEWYAPHVLKELGGLLEEIRTVSPFADRRALAMVFSSIVIKVSRQRADTAERVAAKRIRKGLATEFFLRKAHELAGRWARLAAVAKGPPPELLEVDALRLSIHPWWRRRKADLILTSPPYGGTYDYAAHHRRRIAWLGLDDRKLRRHEMGSRRSLTRDEGIARWEREVDSMLSSMRAVLSDDGLIVLVTGDAQIGEGPVGRHRIEAPAQLARLAPRRRLRVAAVASQRRVDYRGGPPRQEHLVALRPI